MTQTSGNGLMSFDEFRQLLSDVLHVPSERIIPGASFINDLAVDSIRMVEMLLRIEELGITIPSEAAWSIVTVQDAYDFYRLNVPPEMLAGDIALS